MTDAPPSPLAATDPDSLTALFSADPLTLTDADILTAVIELRRRRNAFTAEEAAKSLKEKSKRTKPEAQTPAEAAAADKPPGEITLEDL